MENSGKETEELVMDTKLQDKVVKPDDNLKSEDIEGLQRLRLVQEECNKPLIGQNEALKSAEERKVKYVCDAGDAKVVHPQVLEEVKDEGICNIDQSSKLDEEGENVVVARQSRKPKGVDNVGLDVKPALVRKEVGELHGLTERQQKFLQDFHVKFVLEGSETDDSVHESGSSRHPEFLELKKRLEEEEKYVRPTLPQDDEECDLDMNETKPNNLVAMEPLEVESPIENSESSSRAGSVTRDTMTNNSSRNCEKVGKSCQLASTTTGLLESPDVKNAMTKVADDGCGGLQGYNNCDGGKTGCHFCCRRSGKQLEEEEEESDVLLTDSMYSVLNVVCPISGKPVVDLEYPVRSEECEHIYERASALHYIATSEKDTICLCAVAGCQALLTEKKLVSDSRLWQDIDELRQINTAVWESRMLVNIDDSDDD